MYSFGSGAKGQLGHGDAKDYITPQLVESMQWNLIQSIACGGESAAALTGFLTDDEIKDRSNRQIRK